MSVVKELVVQPYKTRFTIIWDDYRQVMNEDSWNEMI